MAKTLAFGEFRPDLSDVGSQNSVDILNVVPRGDGYGPFPDLVAFTTALPGPCRGYFFARRSDGAVAIFAGTETNLYRLDNTLFTWVLVSKGNAPYGALAQDAAWQFAQFNDLVIAAQASTVPQKFILSSATNFVDLGGSPPQAAFVNIINRIVVLTGLLSNPRRIQWSDLDAPEVWTAGVGQSDFQDLPDGGSVGNLSGGDAYGFVFQQESIRSLTYAPGSITTFQISRISTQETLFAANSIVNIGDKTFYLGASGFKMVVAGGKPMAIGKERVDRFFFANVDTSALNLIVGASDPTATRVYWPFKSKQGAAGAFDSIMVYDYALGEAGQWSLLKVSGQSLASLSKPGVTLEQLDAIAPTPLVVTGAAAGTGGVVRLTLNAVSNANFAIAGQNFIVVQGITPSYMNGAWPVNVIDGTHIDLVGSTYGAAYVSGGAIGGSMDAMTISFDNFPKASLSQLSAFDTSNRLGFFNGPNLEAVMETAEGDPEGKTVWVSGVRPMTDCQQAYVAIGSRFSIYEAVAYDPEYLSDGQGWCEAYTESRYLRGKLRCPYGATWMFASGCQPDVELAGDA